MIPGLCSAFYRAGTKGSFTVTASPSSTTTNDTPGTITSPTYTATAMGGSPAYTYLWVYQSGVVLTITTSTASTTTFSDTLLANSTTTSTYLCQVTDSSSTVVDSNLVTIILHATHS